MIGNIKPDNPLDRKGYGVLFRCSLCGLEQRYRSIQKGVGQNWRKAEFLIHSRALWFCPNHFIVGYELNKTIEFTVEILKVDIVESVRERVLLDETLIRW